MIRFGRICGLIKFFIDFGLAVSADLRIPSLESTVEFPVISFSFGVFGVCVIFWKVLRQ